MSKRTDLALSDSVLILQAKLNLDRFISRWVCEGYLLKRVSQISERAVDRVLEEVKEEGRDWVYNRFKEKEI